MAVEDNLQHIASDDRRWHAGPFESVRQSKTAKAADAILRMGVSARISTVHLSGG